MFAKDNKLKYFLDRKPDASVFPRLLINHMNKYTSDESMTMIAEYARGPDGVAWSSMRFACRLPPVAAGEPPSGTDDYDEQCPSVEEKSGSAIWAMRYRAFQ